MVSQSVPSLSAVWSNTQESETDAIVKAWVCDQMPPQTTTTPRPCIRGIHFQEIQNTSHNNYFENITNKVI